MIYSKPFKTFSEQADRLIGRGLVADRDGLIKSLEKIGYYRFTGYLVPYKNQDDTYRGKVDLSTVLRLYESCKKSYKNSKETFIKHFKNKYGDNCDLPPYWMLANIMDFGQLCTLYSGASANIRQIVASRYGVTSKVLDSWLRSIRLIRNVCAHHSRLWNKAFGFAPKCPKDASAFENWNFDSKQKLYNNLLVIKYLLQIIDDKADFVNMFNQLLNDHKDIPVYQMGFPSNQVFLA